MSVSCCSYWRRSSWRLPESVESLAWKQLHDLCSKRSTNGMQRLRCVHQCVSAESQRPTSSVRCQRCVRSTATTWSWAKRIETSRVLSALVESMDSRVAMARLCTMNRWRRTADVRGDSQGATRPLQMPLQLTPLCLLCNGDCARSRATGLAESEAASHSSFESDLSLSLITSLTRESTRDSR